MGKQSILVIDDDADLCASLKVLLENAGYEMSSAGSKAEGLAKTRCERPDLVILDVMMETWQDGFDLSREFKSNPELRAMPILMLTSVEARTGIEFRSSAGDPTWLPVDGYLDKPAAPVALLAEVRRLLPGPGIRRSITGVATRGGSAPQADARSQAVSREWTTGF